MATLRDDGPRRDRLRRSHALRQGGRRSRIHSGDGARRDRDPRGARPRRRRGRGHRLRRDGTGSPGGRRAGAGAAGGDRGAGIPKEVPADTINKVCASSIRAVEIAELMIAAGTSDVVVTGGMESMSCALYLLPKARFGYRLGHGEVLDHMVFDGLTSTFDGLHMVQQASSVSRELGISREDQDAWAYRSRISAPRPRRTPGASTTRSSPSATSPRTRASAATRRSRSSRR